MKNILITGGCGFIGSNIAISLKLKYPNYNILTFDNLKRRGSELNIDRLKKMNIEFIHGDIRNSADFELIEESVDCIIDAAAEPSVLEGLKNGLSYLVDTNLMGTINTLNFALKNNSDFIFLSTSRVYPIQQLESIIYEEVDERFKISSNQVISGVTDTGISEKFPIAGHRSFYGACKLSSELLINEYCSFAGLKTVINRCGVVAGPWQMGKVDQGVIVLWVAKHYWKQELSYIGYNGEGKQVRDVLSIDDLTKLVDYEIHNMNSVNNETFNVGGGVTSSTSLKELTAYCQKVTGNQVKINRIMDNRPADIPLYLTDNFKVSNETGWTPQKNVENIVEDIYEWIKSNETSLSNILR